MFHVWVGIAAALLGAIPICFMKTKSSKCIGLLVALAIGFLGFSVSPYWHNQYLGWQFEHEIKKQPLFALIAKNYPQDFSVYVNRVKQHLEKDHPELISNESTLLVNRIFYQSLRHASDDYVVLYLKATLDLYHYLNAQDPRAVVKLENGDNTIEYDLDALYQRKDFQARLAHLLDSKRFVIGALVQTKTPLSEKNAATLLQGVLTDLGNKFGEKTVQEAFTDKQISANLAAQIIIEFYTSVLGTGKENAAAIMRYIADQRTK